MNFCSPWIFPCVLLPAAATRTCSVPMKKRNDRDRRAGLAPSIRKAHGRVRWTLFGSFAHAGLLVALGAYLALQAEPSWVPAALCFAGAPLAPLLGLSAYRGNSFSALLLFVSVVTPFGVAWLAELDLRLPLVLLLMAPPYWVGLRGAMGLRGRRGSRRGR
jgi:hypothetical protein